MTTVTPYLTVKGAADAIEFYKKAFGASENMRMPAEDGKRLMHASLSIGGGELFLSDEFPEHGGTPAPSGPIPAAVALGLAAAGEVDAIFKQAVAAGAARRPSAAPP